MMSEEKRLASARRRAIDIAMDLNGAQGVDDLIKDAAKIADFLVDDVRHCNCPIHPEEKK